MLIASLALWAPPLPDTQGPASSNEHHFHLCVSLICVKCIPLNMLIASYLPIPYSRNIQVVLWAKYDPQQLGSIGSSSDPCA